MTTLDSDFAFGKMFRKATAADFGLRQEHDAFADTDADGSKARGGMAALSIFAGLGIMSAVIFTTGYLALLSDTPAIWIHRLMALTVAQSILISAVAMKLLPLIERRRLSVRIITDARANRVPPLLDQSARTNEAAAIAATASRAGCRRQIGRTRVSAARRRGDRDRYARRTAAFRVARSRQRIRRRLTATQPVSAKSSKSPAPHCCASDVSLLMPLRRSLTSASLTDLKASETSIFHSGFASFEIPTR